jgi:L-aspartate oxidase
VIARLRQAGVDPARQRIPVSPAAHYMMGGIATDLDARSTLTSLFAVGECSCTGLHGANRLASNSLSECFVFGARAARAALEEPPLLRDEPATAAEPPPRVDLQPSRLALWRHAGLERDAAGLKELLQDAHPLVRLVGACALAREETRGAHARRDFPDTDPTLDERHFVVGDQTVQERWT